MRYLSRPDGTGEYGIYDVYVQGFVSRGLSRQEADEACAPLNEKHKKDTEDQLERIHNKLPLTRKEDKK
jgi:hypothetical protein